ncbi:zincin-like metallopeptidase domain-containing protein [Bacillus cereus]|uniref:zincin-like metallopeptidase domain-containing protein n=1 Tax=Bacillus cereus TaxID=1396 RepID=UPI0025709347|nr:zincin-like metallopeptidase domain-containing protein [Bacillus cereus]WJE22417.1 zincin-like metallopeptidase domain-containing protein [Bacillus cereus]
MSFLNKFSEPEHYYSVAFHECIHSTGHTSRLKRDGIIKRASFGDETYSKEELVAEMGAAMLCHHVGISQTIDNSAAYIFGWLQALKNDKNLVVQAASRAQKAFDYMIGNTVSQAKEQEKREE